MAVSTRRTPRKRSKSPRRKSPAKAKKKAAAAAKPKPWRSTDACTLVLRIQYTQCFVMALLGFFSSETLAQCFNVDPSLMRGTGVEMMTWWCSLHMFNVAMHACAAAQGSYPTKRKALQYGMAAWIISLYGHWNFSGNLIDPNALYYNVAWTLTNLGVSVWAVYGCKK